MKSLFNQTDYETIRARVHNLNPDNARLWGTMNIAQMMAHCSIGFEYALGKAPFVDKSNFILRTLVKRLVLKAVKKGDLGKNQRTFPEFIISDERSFETEKNRLLANIDEFYAAGQRSDIGRHAYFGKFSKDNWGALQYEHTNHHLSQFSA